MSGALRTAVAEFFDDGCPQRAAAISYYALVSLFPIAILAVAAFGLVVNDKDARENVIAAVLDVVPLREDRGRRELHELLVRATSGATSFGAAGLVTLMVTATSLMGSLRQGLNAAWDVEDARPFVRAKLLDLGLVIMAGVAIAISIAGTLVAGLAGSLFGALPSALVNAIAAPLLSLAVILWLYCWAPARSTRVAEVWPGALVAAAGFEAAKHLFSLYLQTFADYGDVYSSLGTVIAFMTFVFVASCVLLFGAEVAAGRGRRARVVLKRSRTRGGSVMAERPGNQTPDTPTVSETELRHMKVDELREEAREHGIADTSGMRKEELVQAVAQERAGGETADRDVGSGGGVRTGPGTSDSLRYSQEIDSPDDSPERAGRSLVTTSHDVIRQWAEKRGGVPATVDGTEHGDHLGVLRLDFGGDGENLRRVDWEEWFATFDARRLNFIYQEERSDGRQSNFFRLESPDREDG